MLKRVLIGAAALVAMATAAQADNLYLTEFRGAPPQAVYYQAARMPAVRETVVPITGASVQSLIFTADTGLVRVQCDIACHVNIATAAAATTMSMRMTAGQTEYFVVLPGQRLAVLAAAAP